MALALTLALLAAGVLMLWAGITGTPLRPALVSIVTNGTVPTKAPAS